METKSGNSLIQHGDRTWIIGLGILAALPLLYLGYCWGLWGRHSLLLQYLFQCSCPAASMEARFSKELEVVIPGCIKTGVIISPGGRLLYVREQREEQVTTYLLNVETKEKIPFDLPTYSSFSFLTDNLLYISLSYLEEMYIWDQTTGKQYPVHRFRSLYRNAEENGDVNLSLLAEALQKAKYVFLIEQDRTIVALGADFPASSDYNFLTGYFDIPGFGTDRVEQFLQSNKIAYQTILPYFPEEVVSPDGRFIARPDGIYLAKTGQKIVEGYSASTSIRIHSGKYFFARGWTDEGKAVIYSKFLNPCLVEFFHSCYFEVPQPVVKLKVPAQYLVADSQ